MEGRRFQGYNCDLIDLQESVEIYFVGKGFRVMNFHKGAIYLTQAYKNELGDKSVFIKIVGTPDSFEASMGMGEKIRNIQDVRSVLDRIPFAVKLFLGELGLESDFWDFFTTQAQLKRNTFGLRKTSAPQPSPILREREIVREVEIVYCRYCGAKNNARRTSCTRCGGELR